MDIDRRHDFGAAVAGGYVHRYVFSDSKTR